MGYVGLPLALALSQKFKVIGYDKCEKRTRDLKIFKDTNNEHNSLELRNRKKMLSFSSDHNDIDQSNVYIVCVPTPLKKKKFTRLELFN